VPLNTLLVSTESRICHSNPKISCLYAYLLFSYCKYSFLNGYNCLFGTSSGHPYHKLDDNLLLWYFTENYIFQKEKKYDVVLARNAENCLRKHLHSMVDRK
jgi:hypothetical protein